MRRLKIVPARRFHTHHKKSSPTGSPSQILSPLPLRLDPSRLGPIIIHQFLEPRMLQCLAGRDPLLRVVYEDLTQQIQELAVKVVGRWDGLLELLHAAHKFPRLARRVRLRVVQNVVLEEPRGAVLVVTFGDSLHFADEALIDRLARDGLEVI